ncbi:molybdate ABC transporter permease subunit [Autumnicola musiva]|uniref:molybdate ABC transporter permease subunit n=1 Tax=Autumnicola musiva TaxID=3075589 RepID=UPI003D7865AE
MEWEPLLLTFKLAAISTLILLIIGVPLAYWLAHTKTRLKPVVEAVVSMPIILPPTVLGFYLLIALGNSSFFGRWLNDTLGIQLVFSFSGLVLASVIYSLPFMVQPVQSGFAALPQNLREASYSLGKSKFNTFSKVLLPNIKTSLLTGMVLTFAHTVGEFGVVLMIGGNIPGETRVASIAIYDEVEALNYDSANQLSFVLFVISFTILLLVYFINNGKKFWR